jgi:MFS family permease
MIFACQSVLTMGTYALPVVIPVAASDLGVAPESVGFLVATIYTTAMLVGLTSGSLLARFGPTRLFQLLLLTVAAGTGVLVLGFVGTAIVSAVLIGVSSGPMNPTGSLVLSRAAPPDIRALVFSLKQCGTPVGGMLAGTILPPLMLAYDWQLAVLTIPVLALALVLFVPAGELGQREPEKANADGSIRRTFVALKLIWTDRPLRAVTLCGFGLAVCQMGLVTYLVVYLWRSVGYSPAQAGLIFAALHVSGIVSRIVLGLIADTFLSTRWLLVIVGVALSAVFALIVTLEASWPLLAVYAVMALAGASGNGWVGLYFAELARLSPCDRIAEVAAGSQFVTYLGIVCGPMLFAALLYSFGSYPLCFSVLAVISLICGIYLAFAGGER